MEATKKLIPLFNDELSRVRAASTAKGYANGLARFAEFMGERPLCAQEFIAFPAWLTRRSYAKKTIGVYLAASKKFLDWLIVQKILEPTYSDGVRVNLAYKEVGRKQETKLPRYADPDDIQTIRQQAYQSSLPSPIRERNIALIEFLYSSGCRINEACTLRAESVKLKTCQAKVTGKGSKERWVSFSELCSRRIQEYWTARGNSQRHLPVFARHDDGAGGEPKPLSTIGARVAIREIALAAGIEGFHPHLFRHHFGTKTLNETGDLASTQDLLGHASPASTRIYAKVTPGRLSKIHHQIWG